MLANILPLHTPSTPGLGFKGQNIFSSDSSRVAYQISSKVGHAHAVDIITMGGLGEAVVFPLIR